MSHAIQGLASTQDGRGMVDSSDKIWSIGERNGKPVFLLGEPHEQEA